VLRVFGVFAPVDRVGKRPSGDGVMPYRLNALRAACCAFGVAWSAANLGILPMWAAGTCLSGIKHGVSILLRLKFRRKRPILVFMMRPCVHAPQRLARCAGCDEEAGPLRTSAKTGQPRQSKPFKPPNDASNHTPNHGSIPFTA
jgi:hypothetical protein